MTDKNFLRVRLPSLAPFGLMLMLALTPGAYAHAQDATAPADEALSVVPTMPQTAATPPAAAVVNVIEGKVSYYGRAFAGRRTANGERFDPNHLTMAHKTLPFGTVVRVINLWNNLSVLVRVNDRGPFVGGRVGDLSERAAQVIGIIGVGVVHARLEVLNLIETLTVNSP